VAITKVAYTSAILLQTWVGLIVKPSGYFIVGFALLGVAYPQKSYSENVLSGRKKMFLPVPWFSQD